MHDIACGIKLVNYIGHRDDGEGMAEEDPNSSSCYVADADATLCVHTRTLELAVATWIAGFGLPCSLRNKFNGLVIGSFQSFCHIYNI